MMAQREQAQSANAGQGPEKGLQWSRVMVGYLIVLSIWLWESPTTVTEFLSEGSNLQVVSILFRSCDKSTVVLLISDCLA